MAGTLSHRGPDDGGTWVDASTGAALGFRRLSVIDPSDTGRQPMISGCRRYVVVFNGEIYNFGQLRRELEAVGVSFRGTSDTEVFLAAMTRWGVLGAVRRTNGMFAFGVWDRSERILTLGRDRLGEKPLYYGWVEGAFLFGSELKALRAHPAFRNEIDRDSLALYLRHNYIPAPRSVYRGVAKLPPATLFQVEPHLGPSRCGRPTPYWSALEAAEAGVRNPVSLSDAEAVDTLEAELQRSVGMRMVADVPLGAFLSGGIDSSLVVALMQAESKERVRTFTIGFTEPGYDEAIYAKRVATHLDTLHTELYVSPKEAQDVIPRLPGIFDEPFADSSQIPTLLVSQLARRDVTVILSGDGGDELFGGYPRYFLLEALWHRLKRLPPSLRATAATAMTKLSPGAWDHLFRLANPLLPARARQSHPGDKIHKLAALLVHERPEHIFRDLVSLWRDPESVVLDATEPATALSDPGQWLAIEDLVARMMYLDSVTYLPDDILVKVDRTSMAASLEARVPLLDHHLFELAWRMPQHLKVRNHQGKWLLRQVLRRHVPEALFDRPKMGFGVPIGDWLRGPLRPWAEDLLDERRLADEGFLKPDPVRRLWSEHLEGRRDWKFHLWAVLMFEAWLAQER